MKNKSRVQKNLHERWESINTLDDKIDSLLAQLPKSIDKIERGEFENAAKKYVAIYNTLADLDQERQDLDGLGVRVYDLLLAIGRAVGYASPSGHRIRGIRSYNPIGQ